MTTEKTLDEQIQEIEDDLVRTRFEPKPIEVQLAELEEYIENNGPVTLNSVYYKEEPYHKKEKKKLLTLIDEQETIIQFLTKQLEKVEKEKVDLEEKLECLRCVYN